MCGGGGLEREKKEKKERKKKDGFFQLCSVRLPRDNYLVPGGQELQLKHSDSLTRSAINRSR